MLHKESEGKNESVWWKDLKKIIELWNQLRWFNKSI